MFEHIAFMGIGLIGSSLARVVMRDGLAKQVSVYTRSEQTLDKAKQLDLGHHYTTDPAQAVRDADLVMICVPVGAYDATARAFAPALKEGAIVTDVGSTKCSVLRDLTPHIPDGVHLVPGHPIAGTEHSGPEAGFCELFENRWTILTPPPGTDREAVAKVRALWEAAGSMVDEMDAEHHDKVLGITSHLPHLIAYTIVGTAANLSEDIQREVVKYSASGFRDFTRIAASDPTMWRDIFLNNKEAVLEMLQRFSEDITAMQRAIRWGESDILFDAFSRTRHMREEVIEKHQAGSFNPVEPPED